MLPNREFHPVAGLFPLLRGEAFRELVADIQNHGLLEPILVDAEGRILDGRNRYLACLQAGVEPRFVAWQEDEGSPVEMVLSRNLRRRHLDESQRALVAARLAKLLEKGAASRKGRRTDLVADLRPGQRLRSCAEAAALVNVSPRLVSYAIKVLRNGCDGLIEAVESGEVAVSTAAVLAGLPAEDQSQALAGGPQAAAAKAREQRGRKDQPTPALRCPGSFGIFPGHEPGGQDNATPHGIVLLWVAAAGLADAVDALQSRGFRYEG